MKKFLLICAVFVISVSCATIQKEISIDIQKSQLELNLEKLESRIIPLEAIGGVEARKQSGELRAIRSLVDTMEKESAADTDYSGKLSAWSGRLAILEGRYSEAQRLYRQSRSASPGNLPSIVLAIRLEGDPGKRLELTEQELAHTGFNTKAAGYGELQIEKASSLMDLFRFAEAAGAFDAAFTSGLAAVYREHYQSARDRAWELRDSGGSSGIINIIDRGGLTWKDAVSLAKNETRLLRFITAGRDMSDAELLMRLSERSFIPPVQDITLNDWPVAALAPNDPVLRGGGAWFIWRLYAEARADRGLLSRYSTRYATGSRPRSPIADLPVFSPFFDSILGCVETELMSLPDGRNFIPNEPIRAAEFLSILKRIDN